MVKKQAPPPTRRTSTTTLSEQALVTPPGMPAELRDRNTDRDIAVLTIKVEQNTKDVEKQSKKIEDLDTKSITLNQEYAYLKGAYKSAVTLSRLAALIIFTILGIIIYILKPKVEVLLDLAAKEQFKNDQKVSDDRSQNTSINMEKDSTVKSKK
jgi:hypothetical protein